MATVTATMIADDPPELRVARRLAGAAAATFMPYMPVSTVSGMKIVEMIVSTFITLFSWFETFDRCASSRLVMRSWK